MKTIFTVLTMIGLLTFCLAGSLSAERLLYEHTVNAENEDVDVTEGHPWWQGDGDATTRDGDITVSAEKRIFDVSESQAKSTVSSSVSISCNVDDGSFVGVAQIKGTADTGVSAYLASSYQGIASSGIPDPLSTSDLDTYQGKSGNANKTAYVVRLPGVNSSLLYSGIERHGVLLKKGTSLGPIPIVPTRSRELDFGESASTVKQKKVGATDSEIIAMFSPYASANGSAETNGGASISNQVPSVSADTSMSGKTTKNTSSDDDDDTDTNDNDDNDDDDDSNSQGASLTPSSGSSTAAAGSTYTVTLTTPSPFRSVYWYVAAPGTSGLGALISSVIGGSSSTSASLSWSIPSDASADDYVITAYVYNFSDSSVYEVRHTVSVTAKPELMACGHPVGTPGSHVSANFGWCGHDDWNCAEEHHLRVCPRNARGERCTESYHGFYFLCKGEHVHKYPSDATPTQQPPTQQPSTQQPTQQPTRGLCGHTYSASVAASHRQVSCPTQNGKACVYSVYYVCAPHTHVYPSGNDDDDADDDDNNNGNNGNNAKPSTNTPSAPSVPTPPKVVYQPCGVHTTAVGGDHSMQASCSRDPRCISQNFYYCQHESHEYSSVSLRPCGHSTTASGDHSLQASCSETNSRGDRCTVTGFYACQSHTHRFPAAPPPPKKQPSVACPAHSWTSCGGTTSHAATCTGGHSYYTCASQAWHQDRTCTRCGQTYQDCGNSASSCQSNHWHTDQAIAPIKCGASGWTGCTTSVSSSTEHRRTCRENHQYWTCGTAVPWHKNRTCARCGWTYSNCGNSATACQGSRWHTE